MNLALLSIRTRLDNSLIPGKGDLIRSIRSNFPRDYEALDLAPASVNAFNSTQQPFRRIVLDRHGTPTATAFYSVSADADSQQDGIFGAEEGFNMITRYSPANATAALVTAALSAQTLYWVMESGRSGNPFAVLPCDLPIGPSNVNWNILCTRRGTPPFSYNVAKNDMIVSRASARHPEFQELFGVWKNHSTVGECGRMRDVIQFILGSDPLAGGAPSSVTCPNP